MRKLISLIFLGSQICCAGGVTSQGDVSPVVTAPKIDGVVSMVVTRITSDRVYVKLRNGLSQTIYINLQPANDRTPAIVGARIICHNGDAQIDYGERSDAAIAINPFEAGSGIDFDLWIYKPLPQDRQNCEVTTRYLDNAHAVDLIYKLTRPPHELSLEEERFIDTSSKYVSAPLGPRL